jgi:hypothetical protein
MNDQRIRLLTNTKNQEQEALDHPPHKIRKFSSQRIWFSTYSFYIEQLP